MATETKKRFVLFVCSGNTCRSPMAEALFCKLAAESEKTGWNAQSAGLHCLRGEPATAEAIAVSAENGIDLKKHISRPMTDAAAAAAAMIVAMTLSQADELRIRFPFAKSKVRQIGVFHKDCSIIDIADPFGGTLRDYRQCFSILNTCVSELFSRISMHDGRC